MRAGTWNDTAVRTVAARAILDGTEHDLDGVTLTSEMSTDLPVVGGAAVAVTDGTVAWPQDSVVAVTTPHPFVRGTSGWPPPVGTKVLVEVGDGVGQWWQQVNGYVDSTTGDIGSPTVDSRVIDRVDALSVPINHDALLASMPPESDVGLYRRVGLTGTYVTDLCARAAGFCATPPRTPTTRLSVPCMGSLWPEVGTSARADRWTITGSAPRWLPTSWGLAAWDVNAEWDLVSETAEPEMTVCMPAQPDGAAMTAAVVNEAGVGVFIQAVASDDTVRVGVRTPSQTVLATLPRLGVERAAVVVAMTAGQCTATLRLADGRSQTVTSSNAAFTSGWAATKAYLQGDGAMGGLLVEHSPGPWVSLNTPATAQVDVSAIQFLDAMPALRGEKALTLLTEQARGECASVWIDSTGRLRWVGRGILELGPVVATKTTDLTVDNLAWADNLEHVREQVVIKRRLPAISRHARDSILLWQGSAQKITSGQEVEEWLDPGADVDWIMPDLGFVRISVDGVDPTLPYGSKTGAVFADDDPDTPEVLTSTSGYNFSVETFAGTIKVLQSADTLPSGKTLVTKLPDDAVNIPRHWRGESLPLFRGKGKVQWAERSDTYATGTAAAVASYEHDCGWWVQNDIRADELRLFLVDALKEPTPEITGVDIDPDPRLELGDKIALLDPSRTGLSLDLVITGIRQSWSGGVPTMTLSGRVTRVEQATTVIDPASSWDALIAGWEANT